MTLKTVLFLLVSSNQSFANEKIYFHPPDSKEVKIIQLILEKDQSYKEDMKEYPINFKNDIIVAWAHLDGSKEPEMLFVNSAMYWSGSVSRDLKIYKHKKSEWINVSDDDFIDNDDSYIELLDKKDYGWHEYLDPFDNHVRIFDKHGIYQCPSCPDQG